MPARTVAVMAPTGLAARVLTVGGVSLATCAPAVVGATRASRSRQGSRKGRRIAAPVTRARTGRCGDVCPTPGRGYPAATMEPLPCELPMGAVALDDGRARFRVWAPTPDELHLRVGGREHALEPLGLGAYEVTVEAEPGEDYVYV